MITDEFNKIRQQLEEILPASRFIHSIGVSYTAANLALAYDISYEKALLAGLLHDCAKYMSDDEMLAYAASNDIIITSYEQELPSLLHAKDGADLAAKKYAVEDDEILNAIRFHTTGRPSMTLLEQIIFVSDYIEPNRKGLINLKEARTAVFKDINLATYLICQGSVKHIEKKGGIMDPMTLETMEYYKNLCKID